MKVHVSKNYALPLFADGSAHYHVLSATGAHICTHRFRLPEPNGPLDTSEWFEAQKAIVMAIADALNSAGDGFVDAIMEAKAKADKMLAAAVGSPEN